MRSLRFILFSTKLALTKGHILTAVGAGVASQVCRITFLVIVITVRRWRVPCNLKLVFVEHSFKCPAVGTKCKKCCANV
jgi:hypothetical protein